MKPLNIIHQHYTSLSDAQCEAVLEAFRLYLTGDYVDGLMPSVFAALALYGVDDQMIFRIAMERSSDWVRAMFEEVTE